MKPNIEKLTDLYFEIKSRKITFIDAGKRYGISDNGVRKWFKTSGFEKISLEKDSGEFNCSYCNKVFIPREGQWLCNNKEDNFYNYCSVPCRNKAQSEKGIKGRLTQEEYTKLRETMSIRAIGRMYGCPHVSLLRNFKG